MSEGLSLFSSIDDFFSSQKDLSFKEIDISKKEDLVDLGIFYSDVFMECFPNDDERETFDHLVFYLKILNADRRAKEK